MAANPRRPRSAHTSSTSIRANPRSRASPVDAMQVMTAGSGESGSAGYSSRVRCARGYEIGRASCRERVEISGVGGSLKKKSREERDRGQEEDADQGEGS